MSVDDAHAIVRNALEGVDGRGTPGLHDLRLADLNETEARLAVTALRNLHDLDKALAERSGYDPTRRPWTEDVRGDA